MGTFNYRIFKEIEYSRKLDIDEFNGSYIREVEEEVYTIRQVGYDEEGKPIDYTSKPYWPIGSTVEELAENTLQMTVALSKPILTKEDFK